MTSVRIAKSFEQQVWTIILDRPKVKNAVDGPTAKLLYKAFKDFEADSQSKVAVLYGANGTFCAGADLHQVANSKKNGANPLHPGKSNDLGPMGPSRMTLQKPVIAAISGYAVAGGLELACWCDLRVMEENSIMGVFCRRWGVPLIDGGTVRLPRLIGHSRAMDLILTGRPIGAKEALDWGLVNRVVSIGNARNEAEKLAAEIAQFPQITMLSDRKSVYEQWGKTEDEAMQNEFSLSYKCVQAAAVQGAARFSNGEGRNGSFDGFKVDSKL